MCTGVSKSGSPISRCTISLPCRSSAFARASTSNADSVPSRAMRAATSMQILPLLNRSGHSTLAAVSFVRIPAGAFTMGWLTGAPAERPPHVVWVDAFAIARTPATNADSARYRAATGAPPAPFAERAGFDDPRQPVVGLAWDDAVALAAWMDARLPTEAEWERAARGGLVDA